jgi:hypothetical protein
MGLVGYRVSRETIEAYRTENDLPKHNNRPLVQSLGSQIGIQLWLVRVEPDDDNLESDYYVCCFATYSSKPLDPEALLAIPKPPAFYELPQVISVEDDELHRLFAPRSMIFSAHRGEL